MASSPPPLSPDALAGWAPGRFPPGTPTKLLDSLAVAIPLEEGRPSFITQAVAAFFGVRLASITGAGGVVYSVPVDRADPMDLIARAQRGLRASAVLPAERAHVPLWTANGGASQILGILCAMARFDTAECARDGALFLVLAGGIAEFAQGEPYAAPVRGLNFGGFIFHRAVPRTPEGDLYALIANNYFQMGYTPRGPQGSWTLPDM